MNKNTDLTTGGILQKLVFVAFPIIGTQLMQMLYNLTDMFWLGRLSSDDVAASGASGMFLWLGMALMLIGRMGAEIGVSQNKGRGDMETARGFAQTAWQLALGFGVLYGAVLSVCSIPLVSFYDIQETHVAQAASAYLCIIGLGIPASYMTASITGAFNGSGNSRIPFYFNAVGLLMNMILDPFMIFTLGLGIRGAAFATIIAQWTVNILLLTAMKKHRDRPFDHFPLATKPSRARIKQIIRWTLPISLESGLFSLLAMTVTRLVTGFGADALAVQRVGGQIESLSWLIGGGYASALTAYMGQNFGAAQWDRISKGFRISTAAMASWGSLIMLTLFFGGYTLFGLFLPDHGLQSLGALYLRVLAPCQIFACLEGVGSGYFRGTGRTIPASSVSISCNTIRVPLCYWLSSTALGLNGIWYGLASTALLRGLVIYGWAAIAMSRANKKREASGEASAAV